MNLRKLFPTMLSMIIAGSFPQFAQALEIGTDMPMTEIEMKNVDGNMVSLSDVTGDKGTLIIFTCNHCPYVKAWEERSVKAGNKAMKAGFGVIALNSNDPSEYKDDGYENNQKRSTNSGMMYPYVVDDGSQLAKAFGATRTPEFFLFNADGKLEYHGALDDNAQDADDVSAHYLQDAIDAQLRGQTISVPTTKSVGCSIKFYK